MADDDLTMETAEKGLSSTNTSPPPQDAEEGDDAAAAAKATYDRQVGWVEEFGRLLVQESDPKAAVDDDAALLWDADGGKAELARRRERRQAAATERGPVTPS